jgi:hypothetical protein
MFIVRVIRNTQTRSVLFRNLRKIAKSDYLDRHLPVCLFTWNKSATTKRIYTKFDI